MKVKQKSVRVFEIECNDLTEFGAYLEKNGVLLSGFLLLLRGDTKGAFAKECKKRNLCFATMGDCEVGALSFKKDIALEANPEIKDEEPQNKDIAPKKSIKPQARLPLEPKIAEPKPITPIEVKADVSNSPTQSAKTVTISKNLRSGEDINTDTDVMITGRINSGARVKTGGNAVLLDVVDGDVEAWGEYVMLKSIGKGTVTLKGEKIDKNALNGKMKLVTFDGKLSIKDV